MKAVRPHTLKGHALCLIIQLLCIPLLIFRGRKWMRAREFEENPRTMRFTDIIYFAYKYYFRSPMLPSEDRIADHFREGRQHSVELTEVLATVSIGGDLMPYEMIKAEHTQELWDETGNEFFGSDIVFANLETPLDSERKSMFVPEVMLYDMHFNTNEATFQIFSGKPYFKGYSILSIANNHTMDQGTKGIDKTIEFLHFRGIRTVGAKTDRFERDHEVFEIRGVKIAFIAFTYSLNQYSMPEDKDWKVNHIPLNLPDCPLDSIYEQVAACRRDGADIVICSLHAGNAYQAYPSAVTVDLYQRIFNVCGVDIIAGGHPHNLQPWRSYTVTDPFSGKKKQTFAIYSLGDFIAYDIYTWCHLCAYLKIEIGRDSNGDIAFRPLVRPLVMQRTNGHLRLSRAEKVLLKDELSPELRDMKVLYDICMPPAEVSHQ